MNRAHSNCPWCGAHFTQEERKAAVKQKQNCCPVCRQPMKAGYSGKRVSIVLLLAVLLCVLDFIFLVLGVPLLIVWLFTAVCAALLWCFRGSAVVFQKSAEAEKNR